MKKKFAVVDYKHFTVKCQKCGQTTFSRVMLESHGEDLPKNCVNCKNRLIYKGRR